MASVIDPVEQYRQWRHLAWINAAGIVWCVGFLIFDVVHGLVWGTLVQSIMLPVLVFNQWRTVRMMRALRGR